jgi:hypothetical protein
VGSPFSKTGEIKSWFGSTIGRRFRLPTRVAEPIFASSSEAPAPQGQETRQV